MKDAKLHELKTKYDIRHFNGLLKACLKVDGKEEVAKIDSNVDPEAILTVIENENKLFPLIEDIWYAKTLPRIFGFDGELSIINGHVGEMAYQKRAP